MNQFSCQKKNKLYWLIKKTNYCNKGFTLIELLVAILILGILSAISLPNFLNQIGKARETEAKTNLGSIIRSQQAYHYEKSTFAGSLDKLNLYMNLDPGRHYQYPEPTIANSYIVKHQALPLDRTNDRVRNFAAGMYYESSSYSGIVCEASNLIDEVDVPDTPNESCTNGGIKIK